MMQSDGTQKWYLNGQLHRVDGPAVFHLDGYQEWYTHGKLHRVGGLQSFILIMRE